MFYQLLLLVDERYMYVLSHMHYDYYFLLFGVWICISISWLASSAYATVCVVYISLEDEDKDKYNHKRGTYLNFLSISVFGKMVCACVWLPPLFNSIVFVPQLHYIAVKLTYVVV
jgi:hypothetical protein